MFQSWLPNDTLEAIKQFRVAIKGPLTTPVGGGIRSLNVALRQLLTLYVCMRPVQLLPGRSLAGEAARTAGRGDLPREHRGRLRRHRVERRHAGGGQGDRLPEQGDGHEDPAGLRHRHQADERSRLEAADPPRHPVRHRERAPQRHPGPQRQHHEVHRGRVPRLGLRAGQGRSSPSSASPRASLRAELSRRQGPGQGPHRRLHVPAGCCCGRTSTTCWPRRT